MAEPTLSLRYADLQSRIGKFLGFGFAFHGHGTVAISPAGKATLAGTTRRWPLWAASGRLRWRDEITDSEATVTSRNKDTELLIDAAITFAASPNYMLYPWTDDELDMINEALDSGLGQFYNPPPLPGEGSVSHEWSFLNPEITLTIFGDIAEKAGETVTYGTYDSDNDATPITRAAGTQEFYSTMPGNTFVADDGTEYTIKDFVSATQIRVSGDASGETSPGVYSIATNGNYRLPDNHGGFVGNALHFDESENSFYSMTLTSPQRILALRQQNIGSVSPASRPVFAAEIANTSGSGNLVNSTGDEIGQRNTLMIWPEPNGIYTVHAQHVELQNKMAFNEYPLGGQAHGELILASCLAVAESLNDDIQGNHQANFQRLLAASVHRDRIQYAPRIFGSNTDNSDRTSRRGRRFYKAALYEGVAYWGD